MERERRIFLGVEFLIKYDPYCVELSCLTVAAEADVTVRVHLCELGNREQWTNVQLYAK